MENLSDIEELEPRMSGSRTMAWISSLWLHWQCFRYDICYKHRMEIPADWKDDRESCPQCRAEQNERFIAKQARVMAKLKKEVK